MKRQINQSVLVTKWTPKKTIETKGKTDSKPGRPVKIVKNNGWNIFYQRHRPQNLTIKAFGLETGIHPYTLSRWDKGVGSPNFRLFFFFLEYVADKEEIPIEEIFAELYKDVQKYGTEFRK